MCSEYLFLFGYESPTEFAANDEYDTDLESTGFFRILAQSEEEALEWGEELAEWYVENLFGSGASEGWKAGGYASWIEHEAEDVLRHAAESIEAIPTGSFPDFRLVRRAFSD